MKIEEQIQKVQNYSIKDGAKSLSDRFMGWFKVVWIGCKVFYNKGLFAKDIPALAFVTFTSLVPLLAIAFAVARGFGFDEYLTEWLTTTFRSQAVITERLVMYVGNYLQNTSSMPIFVVGLLLMLYSLFALINKVETSFNGIWEAEERPIKKRLYDYTMITFGMGIVVAVSSCLYVFPISSNSSFISFWLSVVSSMAFLILVYRYIPNTYVSWRSVIVPGFLSSFFITALQYGYAYVQVLLTSYNVIYGSLAVLPLFLIWLQLTWTIAIAGVVICYAHQNLHHHDDGVEFCAMGHDEVLMASALILGMICKRFRQPQSVAYTPVELRELTGMPQQVVNGIIKGLADARLIQELQGENKGMQEEMSRYVPICDTNVITYGYMVRMLEKVDRPCCKISHNASAQGVVWSKISDLRKKYLAEGDDILLSEI